MSSLSVKYMAMNSKICILILYKGRFLANDSKLELKMEKIETRCTPPTTHEYTFKISSDFKHYWVRSHASREARQANHANSPIFRCKCAVYWGVQKTFLIFKWRYLLNPLTFFVDQKKQKIILLQFLYVDKTDVTICLESHFWTLITDYWRFSSFFKTYNLFQSNWNFILFRMYNEISTIFKLFSCW